MANNLLVPGGGLEFKGPITLSRGSELRAEKAAEIFYSPFMERHGQESKIYCTGAYPTLPEGVEEPPLAYREGSLMADVLINQYGVPPSRIEIEAYATSTTKNVVIVAGAIAADQDIDVKEIINEEAELGIITRKGHAARINNLLSHLGCNTEFVRVFPVYEDGGATYDALSSLICKLSLVGVHEDVEKLFARDAKLESINDFIRNRLGSAKKIVRHPKKVLS